MNRNWIYENKILDQRFGLGDNRDPEPLRCIEWNGSNQYTWIPVDPVTAFPFTLFGWARTTNTVLRCLVSINDSASTDRFFGLYIRDNAIYIERRNTILHANTVNISNINGVWTSFVVVFPSATTAQVYMNGVLLQSFSGLTGVSPIFNRFSVASLRTNTPTQFFDGRSMHCGFLRRAATLQDAQAFHATGIIPDAEVLLPLDGNSTTVAHNIGSSAAHWLDEPRRNLYQYTENLAISPWGLGISCVPESLGSGIFRLNGFDVSAGARIWQRVTSSGSATWTGSIEVRGEGSDIGKTLGFQVIRGTSGDFTFTNNNTVLTGEWQRISATVTLAANNVDVEIRLNFLTGGPSAPLVRFPQLELGSVATPYQPVLRTGIDYPEATIVNGAAGMLYTGRDVPFSRQNKIGYSTRRNLLEQTRDFGNAYWTKTNVTVTGGFPDPFGGTDAWKVSETAVTNNFNVARNNLGNLVTRSGAVYAKAAERQHCSFLLSNATNATLVFSLVDGSIQFAGNMLYNVSVINAGNGWWRASASINVPNTPFQSVLRTGPSLGTENQYAGVPGNGIFVFGPHLVDGTAITPYQRIGADPGANVRFPALLSDPTKSAATDPLTFSGEVPRNAQLEQANCFTFDGSDDRVAVDLSQWAGPELVTNGTFDSATGWIDSFESTISGGQLTLNAVATARRRQDNVTVNGRTYYFEIDVVSTSNSWRIDNAASSAISYGNFGVVSGIVKGTFVANSATNSVRFINLNTSGTVVVNSVTVRELPSPSLGPELASTLPSPAIENNAGSVGAWNGTTRTMTNSGSVTSGYPRFAFNLGLQTGRSYQVTGNLTGNISQVTSIRLATVGLANDVSYNSATGVFSGVVPANGSSIQFLTDVDGAESLTISSISVRQVGLIPHDGTSLLTYRSQGDGFTGTAGTAFNIRIGDVEHIPCSEGAGNKLHGTKLNQEYLVVNGQASNWTTKQNTYHYNTAQGYSDALSDDAKIATLFAANEVGGWYDVSDRSTMFQDVDGAIPVTASGQTVAIQLDKSRGFALSTDLAINGTFTTNLTGWADGTNVTTPSTIINGEVQITSPGSLTSTVQNTFRQTTNIVGHLPFNRYRISFDATYISGADLFVGLNNSAAPAISGLENGGNKRRYVVDLTGFNTTAQLRFSSATTSQAVWRLDNITLQRIAGNHRYQSDPVKRPQYVKVGNLAKLVYGSNRFFETNAVDFTGTNKVTVWWGGRKLSDAATGVLVELSVNGDTTNGSFYIASAISAGDNFRFNSRGTNPVGFNQSGHTAPVSRVVTGIGDISAPLARIRVNGVESDATSSQGTGNYGNHKLFFGMRAGTTLSASAEETIVIIRGAQTPTNMIQIVENIAASKIELAEFHANPTPPTADFDVRLPASQTNPGFDVLGNVLTNPPVVGLNGAESRINFSPVANSWPTGISIPGADIPTYEFNGNSGSINIEKKNTIRETIFKLEKE